MYDPDNELSVGKILAVAIDELYTKITVPYGTEPVSVNSICVGSLYRQMAVSMKAVLMCFDTA